MHPIKDRKGHMSMIRHNRSNNAHGYYSGDVQYKKLSIGLLTVTNLTNMSQLSAESVQSERLKLR